MLAVFLAVHYKFKNIGAFNSVVHSQLFDCLFLRRYKNPQAARFGGFFIARGLVVPGFVACKQGLGRLRQVIRKIHTH